MKPLIEPLEGRTLFAAAVAIPPAIVASYAAVVADQSTVRADVASTTATFHSIAAQLDSDAIAAGASHADLVLGKKILAAGTKYLAALNSGVNHFNARLTPLLRRLEVAEAAYDDAGTPKTFKRLAAVDRSFSAIYAQFTKLQYTADNTNAVDTGLTALATANPTDTTLNAGVQSGIVGIGTVTTVDENDLTRLSDDVDTFVDQVPIER